MLKVKAIFLSALLTFCCNFIYGQNLILNYGVSQIGLVNFISGNGIITSNHSGNLVSNAHARFSNGNSINLGIDSGIVISTGYLNNLTASPGATMSSSLSNPGDIHLNQITAPALTIDAQHLSFDFRASSDSVEFIFIFASEEYNEKVNTIPIDQFAFLISGPGFPNNFNLAKIPGTVTSININTLNNGQSPGASSGPCVNCSLYRDNLTLGPVSPPVDFSFDGLTVAIKIKFPVWVCANYHFKIVIADTDGDIDDSAIFFAAKSLKPFAPASMWVNGIPYPNGSTINMCLGGTVTLTAPPGNLSGWSTGDTSHSITVNQPGVYEAFYVDSICFAFISIAVVQQGNIQTPVINQQGSIIVSNIVPSPGITYQWFLDGNPIPGATNLTVPVQGNGCYTLMIYEGNCQALSNVICITNTFINELSSEFYTIIPHPVTGKSIIHTRFNSGDVIALKIYDLAGKLIYSDAGNYGPQIIFERGIIDSGIYIIELFDITSKEVINGKIVLN